MANGRRLIDANALMDAMDGVEVIDYAKTSVEFIKEFDRLLYSVRGLIATSPTVDAVEVSDPELLKAIKLLIKQYGHSKQSEYVHSPVAHALFHTWKQIDEKSG